MRRATALRAASLGWLTMVLCWFAAACGSESPTDPTLPVSLQIVSGDNQQAIVGHELPSPLVVQVFDAKGKPVEGQVVNFRVVVGGGSAYAGTSLTNKDGFAQDYWTMGAEPGVVTLEVRAVNPTTGAKQNFATFTATALPVFFTLVVSNDGGGTVTGSGIDCPNSTCSAEYPSFTVVTLSASAGAGFVFVGWTGDCTGTGTCTVSMTASRTVTATFIQRFDLTVTIVGSGTVTSTPPGIDCPGDCTESYLNETPVTLVQTPAAGWVFVGWINDCAGTGSCTVTMNNPRFVTAMFTDKPIEGATVTQQP